MRGYALALFALLACGMVAAGEKRYVMDVNPSEANAVAARNGLRVIRSLPNRHILVAAPDYIAESSVLRRLKADASVRSAETDPDVTLAEAMESSSTTQASLQALPSSLTVATVTQFYGATVRAGYVAQPAADLIHAPQLQAMGFTGTGVVAVIDTGVDGTHPALKGVLVGGYDFIHETAGAATDTTDVSAATQAALAQSTVAFLDSKNTPVVLNQSTVAFLDQSTVAFLDGAAPQDFGHGTMVAGLIHRVAPAARIMPLKAFGADGSARMSDIVRAIHWAVEHGATVINMSFSTTSSTAELQAAVKYAADRKVIMVAAAGNQGKPLLVYPAGYRAVTGAGSTTNLDGRSAFSNYGEASVYTSAPGEALITTYPGNHYAAVWGTSFSAALVSGAAAVFDQAQRGALSFNGFQDALDKGVPVSLEMGDARLQLEKSLGAILGDK
ncbi:MAG: S8 family serine peptidase [Acidobacteria bacterium]|nr:S8 family serine peptidase [Acidobacteriota bacterium]